ncbi:MAG: 3-hydroxyacyl-ACP dehydratase FabZ family protein [Planctomycetota bacterium]
MQYHRHDFSTVEEYLHHRAPYLMVDEIVELTDSSIVTRKTVSDADFFISGHFPGAPIFPGAMMQELTTQSAGILIAARFNPMQQYNTEDPFFNEYALGVLVRIDGARYRNFARPGNILEVTVNLDEHLESLFDFAAVIRVEGEEVMRNRFRLTNIKSNVLQGTS